MTANGIEGSKMDVDAKPGDLRLLAVFCNPEEEDPGYDPPGPGSTPSYVASRPGAQVGGRSNTRCFACHDALQCCIAGVPSSLPRLAVL
jgi:hypothetical protein